MDTAFGRVGEWCLGHYLPCCLGLVLVIALSSQHASVPDIRLRIARASCVTSDISNKTALLLEPVQVAGHDLRSLMMGMGIDLHFGPHAAHMDIPSVVLTGASGTMHPVTRRRLEVTLAHYPLIALCRISGKLVDPRAVWRDRDTRYDDPRACLLAAGIGFSELEAPHAT